MVEIKRKRDKAGRAYYERVAASGKKSRVSKDAYERYMGKAGGKRKASGSSPRKSPKKRKTKCVGRYVVKAHSRKCPASKKK